MDLLRRIGLFFGAAALVLAVYFGGPADSDSQSTGSTLPPELADEPDVYLFDARITEFEPSGMPKYELYAVRMDRFDDTEITRLDRLFQIQPGMQEAIDSFTE